MPKSKKNRKAHNKQISSSSSSTNELDTGLQVEDLLKGSGLTDGRKASLQDKAQLFLPFYLFFIVTCCAEQDESNYDHLSERYHVLEKLQEKLYFASLNKPNQSLSSCASYNECCQIATDITEKANQKTETPILMSDTKKNKLHDELDQLFKYSGVSVAQVQQTGVMLKLSQEGYDFNFALEMALISSLLTMLDKSQVVKHENQYRETQKAFRNLWDDLKKYTQPKEQTLLLQFKAPFVIGYKVVKLPLIVSVLRAFKNLAESGDEMQPSQLKQLYNRLDDGCRNYYLGFALLTQLAQNVRNQLKRQQYTLAQKAQTLYENLLIGKISSQNLLQYTMHTCKIEDLEHQSNTSAQSMEPKSTDLTISQTESLSIVNQSPRLSIQSSLCQQSVDGSYNDAWYENRAKVETLTQTIAEKKQQVQQNARSIEQQTHDLNKIQQQTHQLDEDSALTSFQQSIEYSDSLQHTRQAKIKAIQQCQSHFWDKYANVRELEEQYLRYKETLNTYKQS